MSNQRNWLPEHFIGEIKHLFRLRDKLVHFKPMAADMAKKNGVRMKFFVTDKELGVRCFEKTVTKLNELAPNDDISCIKNIHIGR
jgi:hypothetical protein